MLVTQFGIIYLILKNGGATICLRFVASNDMTISIIGWDWLVNQGLARQVLTSLSNKSITSANDHKVLETISWNLYRYTAYYFYGETKNKSNCCFTKMLFIIPALWSMMLSISSDRGYKVAVLVPLIMVRQWRWSRSERLLFHGQLYWNI